MAYKIQMNIAIIIALSPVASLIPNPLITRTPNIKYAKKWADFLVI